MPKLSSRDVFPLLVLAGIMAVCLPVMVLLSKAEEAHEAAFPAKTSQASHTDSTPHSANIQSFGNNHVEASLSASGRLTIHFYGTQVNQLEPIDADLLPEVSLLPSGEDSIPVSLTAEPYPGEPVHTSSRFIGETGRAPGQAGLTMTIPYDGRTYRVSWRPEQLPVGAVEGGDSSMPKALDSAEAQKLFLTPGGLYTQADIETNGKTTAAAKYGNQMSTHNSHPKPGDPICPISETAANPKFAWVVDGKTYTFCCPPCIEEFVRKAKETPEKIKQPEDYVQP
ncbi:MAG: hypothetical protein QM758_13245 [Armatimonas sp.]